MRNKNTPPGFSAVVELLNSLVHLACTWSFPRPLLPVTAISPRQRLALRIPARRLSGWLGLFLLAIILTGMPAWAGQPVLPNGVPNVFDPEVRARYQPVGMVSLRGNPDFPVLILQNTAGEQPLVMLLGLDARNGKDTWSLASDPIILIVLFADQETILGTYMDTGFAELGKPSGQFMTLGDPTSPGLFDLLRSITLAATRTYM